MSRSRVRSSAAARSGSVSSRTSRSRRSRPKREWARARARRSSGSRRSARADHVRARGRRRKKPRGDAAGRLEAADPQRSSSASNWEGTAMGKSGAARGSVGVELMRLTRAAGQLFRLRFQNSMRQLDDPLKIRSARAISPAWTLAAQQHGDRGGTRDGRSSLAEQPNRRSGRRKMRVGKVVVGQDGEDRRRGDRAPGQAPRCTSRIAPAQPSSRSTTRRTSVKRGHHPLHGDAAPVEGEALAFRRVRGAGEVSPRGPRAARWSES